MPIPYDGPGALAAFGAHKGSGLNFMMEMMAGPSPAPAALAADEPERRKFCNGMLSLYIDTGKVNDQDSMAAEIKSYIAFVKSARTADGHNGVLVPGETERRVMAKRQKEGLPLTAPPGQTSSMPPQARNA